MGRIVTLAQSKGGSGKSCLAMLVSAQMAAFGRRVVVVDADPNQTFAGWHRNAYEGPAFASTSCIAHGEIVDHAQDQAEAADLVLIDTAGFDNLTAATAIAVSDGVIVPVMPDRGSVVEALRTVRQVENFAKAGRRAIPYVVVRTRWRPNGLAERAVMEELSDAKLTVADQHVPHLAAFAQMTLSGVVPLAGIVSLHLEELLYRLVGLEKSGMEVSA